MTLLVCCDSSSDLCCCVFVLFALLGHRCILPSGRVLLCQKYSVTLYSTHLFCAVVVEAVSYMKSDLSWMLSLHAAELQNFLHRMTVSTRSFAYLVRQMYVPHATR